MLVMFSCVEHVSAQYTTDFVLTDLDNESLTQSVQKTLSNLVSEINASFAEKRVPRISNMNIDAHTQASILALWENSSFRCDETEIVESVNHYGTEYEVRNIPFIFPDMEKDEQYHEIAVTFDARGALTSFHMSIGQNLYRQVFNSGEQVKEFRRKQMILDYVEQFRTSYNTKDMAFLNQVFSDDALIITGRVVKTAPKLKGLIDTVSVSLNTTNKEDYLKIVRPKFGIESYDAMLSFTKDCTEFVPNVVMTVVDVVTTKEEQEICKKICESVGAKLRVRPYEE